jgi:hypothetical protein
MSENSTRSIAQREADKRYFDKIKGNKKVLGFTFSREEADEIDLAISATGMTKADFLRRAVTLMCGK